MRRVVIDKLDERSHVRLWLHWAEHRSWREPLLNLF
jgi:hypothetical protein